MKKLKKFAWASIGLILLVAAGIGLKQFFERPCADAASLRKPAAGALLGFADRYDTYAWVGVPYAQPPVGPLRWRAPQPLAAWQEPREALAYGDVCTQLSLYSSGNDITGSEDCLTLNIWTPRLTVDQIAKLPKRLPVMVWIHGGGNTLGSSQMSKAYQLAGTQQVVAISFNYRLGVFGWLSHPALRAGAAADSLDASPNFGLLDQIAALRWVRDNIAAFGGDPDNVTIFGESAGGHDVFALLAAKPAHGLFHRAIAQSGVMRSTPQEYAENFTDDSDPGHGNSSREYISKLLIADHRATDRATAKAKQQALSDAELLEFLRTRTPQQLLAVVQRFQFGMYRTPNVIADGIVLPKQTLLSVFRDPALLNRVPLIVGSNRDEYKMFLNTDPQLVDKRFGFLPQIKNIHEYNRITGYFSDSWKALAVDEVADAMTADQDRVFVYRFDWDEEPNYALLKLRDLFGAAHGLDMPFTIGAGSQVIPLLFDSDNKAGRDYLTTAMMAYWSHFAATGVPGSGGRSDLPEWKPWSNAGAKLMLFDTPKDGGARMSDFTLRAADLKQRLREDLTSTGEQRCRLYAQIFLLNSHAADFWSEDEYHALGCAGYPPRQFPPAI